MWLFGDSFDHYTDLTTKYDTVSASDVAISVGTGRYGTNNVKFTSHLGRLTKGITPGTETAGVFCAMALRAEASFTGSYAFANLWNGPTSRGHVVFAWNNDGSISAWNQADNESPLQFIPGVGGFGLILGTTPAGLVPAGTYAHIELFVKVHPTAGVVTIRVNGDEVLALTGRITQNASAHTGVSTAWIVGMPVGMLGTIEIDDLMLYDDTVTGDGVFAFLGDLTAECLFVTGPGLTATMSRSGGATNASCVDEALADGDTTYVESDTIGQGDTYTHGPLVRVAGGIKCVQLVMTARKTSAGTRAIAGIIQRGGVDVPGADIYLTTAYQACIDVRTRVPGTGGAWSAALVNATEIGQTITV